MSGRCAEECGWLKTAALVASLCVQTSALNPIGYYPLGFSKPIYKQKNTEKHCKNTPSESSSENKKPNAC